MKYFHYFAYEVSEVRELLRYPTVHQSLFYKRLPDDKVECTLCERRCPISPGYSGFCKTRMNIEGKLYTLNYGDVSVLESRPIEIKPFFHYFPGSTALTFSSWSCNFDCIWCQNFHLSKTKPVPARASYWPPEKIVNTALQMGDEGLCVSFQEPTVLTDWVLPVFRMGSDRNLYCSYVSNGYMTLEALRLLTDSGMDGIKIDMKGDAETYQKYCGGADIEKVWRNIREAKRIGLHLEIVNLVITDVNDDEECIRWVVEKHLKEAGSDTPLHFTRYYPAYKFHNPPTKIEILEWAYKTAKKAGVHYLYLGNVPGHQYEHTYCPNCGEPLIKRFGYHITRYKVTKNKKCPKCKQVIPITGRPVKKSLFNL